jgi:type IV pilus assembly protein PilB
MSRLGELLVREKMLSLRQLHQAQDEAKRTGKRLGATLSRLGYVNDQALTQFVAKQYSLPSINLSEIEIDASVLKLVPREICEKHQVIPVRRNGPTLIVAMTDPSNIYAIDELKFFTQYNIEPVVASESGLEAALSRYYDKGPDLDQMVGELDVDNVDYTAVTDENVNVVDLENQAGEAPVVKLCNAILLSAIKKKASDIHIEPYDKNFRVRFRIDGILQEEMRPPLKFRNAITSRLKIMSSLDIAERRLPQDGRIKLKMGGTREMDFRVSVLPTLYGEKIVLRLLDRSQLQLDTTDCNISTAEDPVEFNLHGINQVQMHEDIGLNFATALRAFLRQDPNIIMVGEIRDFETAEIGVKAALTGHLVLSTLHTNDAPSTVSRLLNMGIEPFLVTASVNLVLAQRLARRICTDCKVPTDKHAEALANMGMTEEQIRKATIYMGRGCNTCNNTGYKGRVALYEAMPFTDPLKELVLAGASAAEIKTEMIRGGVQSLRMAGNAKILEGITTPEEVLRTTVEDS